MALGNTDISTNLVKNAIGESVNAVGALVTSINVNRWGINSPYAPQQNKYWGVNSPPAPHELGMFRGYDHNWRCYGAYDSAIAAALATYSIGNASFLLNSFPSWSTDPGTITHYFDVWFSRSGPSFTNPAYYTKIRTNEAVNNAGQLDISINPTTPPDGGAALTSGTNCYLKVKFISSSARRFDSRTFEGSDHMSKDTNDDDSWIITIPIGADPFTYTVIVGRDDAGSLIVSKHSAQNWVQFDMKALNGYPSSQYIDVYLEINDQSDFLGSKTISLSAMNQLVPTGTQSGGILTEGELLFAIFDTMTLTQWSISNNFYGRIKIGVGGSWQTGFNGTVSNTELLL